VRPAGSESWSTIDLTPRPFLPGDSLRTGAGAGAALSFDDGSRVEVRAHSILALEDAAPERSLLRLELGQSVFSGQDLRVAVLAVGAVPDPGIGLVVQGIPIIQAANCGPASGTILPGDSKCAPHPS